MVADGRCKERSRRGGNEGSAPEMSKALSVDISAEDKSKLEHGI